MDPPTVTGCWQGRQAKLELTGLWVLVIGTVVVALVFDVINGFHDAANSIATVVSTRVLSPRTAVLWAAFFNFVAMFVFAPKVADTISKIVQIPQGDPVYVYVVLAGLVGAIVWDLLTWWWACPPVPRMPSSEGSPAPASPTRAGRPCAGISSGRSVHSPRAAHRLRPRVRDHDRRATGSSVGGVPWRSTASSARGSCSPRRSTRSGTAATTPRRPWASSWRCSSPHGTCTPTPSSR